MKVIVWGTGYFANEYVERKSYHIDDEIIAFVDNNKNLWGKNFKEKEIISPKQLEQIEFDRLVICTIHFEKIKTQIQKELFISAEIISYFEVEESIKNALISKYSYDQNCEIQKILTYYRSHSLNLFGYYDKEGDDIKYPVYYDKEEMPYILFEGKRMFFPRSYLFMHENNLVCVKNILYEQGKHSPHRYIKFDNEIKKDMIIVDAGVCEGNFALRYVEYAKKIYLIESDPEWIGALERTFQPYKEKVIICNKYLSNKDTEQSITLDTLIHERIDILKMDIEGYEVSALEGGESVLRDSNAYCAICSYHKQNDEHKIKYLLQRYGYSTDTSEGFMFFPYDDNIEFRKGVVYGKKSKEIVENI